MFENLINYRSKAQLVAVILGFLATFATDCYFLYLLLKGPLPSNKISIWFTHLLMLYGMIQFSYLIFRHAFVDKIGE
tara:strand:- start:466 stop:696 length:231 start_codon:yes stop_codon:yes gene_type:complete